MAQAEHDARVRAEFGRQAETLSRAAVFNNEAVLARMRDAAALNRSMRALDVACGPGIVVTALAPGAKEVVGCDITPEMLDKARERCAKAGLANVRFVPGNVEKLPFADGEFDVVVSRSAVHHFLDPAAAFREMARVLRPGGRMVTVDVASSDVPEEAALHNALEILRDPSHVRMLSKRELDAHLLAAGLSLQEAVSWNNPREFEEWVGITAAPERAAPLRVVMAELARAGRAAGTKLRIEGAKLLFEHTAWLTVATKP